MTFGGNTRPKKVKKEAPKPWTCKCPVAPQKPGYMMFCKGCGSGRP